VRTTNEIDELFAKVDTRQKSTPGKKQAARMNKLEALLIMRGNEALTFLEVSRIYDESCPGTA
jgi:hypothetical protein